MAQQPRPARTDRSANQHLRPARRAACKQHRRHICGGDEQQPSAAAERTVARLQEGGLTLVIRHGKSDAEINRQEQLRSCSLQRNLTQAGRRQDCDAALIGTWTWQPNRIGLDWFLGKVVPRLPRNFTIRIAGSVPAGVASSHPGVAFVGRVPDSQFINANIGYQLTPRYRVFAVGTNIFDQQRYQLFGGAVIGRRVMGGLSATF